MPKHAVCRVEELPPGQRRIVSVGRRSIGVFNVDGDYYAVSNRCPHKGAPLCRGRLTGLVVSSEPYRAELTREGEILKCPWHGWEFDITTGCSVFNPHRVRVRTFDVTVEPEPSDDFVTTFPVTVEHEMVVVHVPAGS